MLIKESEYIKEIIELLPEKNLRILNFGSQSSEYIKKQPYIFKNIIKPCETREYSLYNLDIKKSIGVDLVGDIFDDAFFSEIKSMQFDVIFVFNLLEHVTDIELMVSRLQKLIGEGKYIIFSGPNKYPIHLDPIDNGFRPEVEDVSMLFSDCSVVHGKTITDYTFSKYLFGSIKVFLSNLARLLAFFYKYNKWRKVIVPKYKWLFKKYEITIVLLKKKEHNF